MDGHDPRTLKWRLDHLEQRVQDIEDQPTMLESAQRLPWERVVFPLLLVVALKLGWISSDIVQSLLGR